MYSVGSGVGVASRHNCILGCCRVVVFTYIELETLLSYGQWCFSIVKVIHYYNRTIILISVLKTNYEFNSSVTEAKDLWDMSMKLCSHDEYVTDVEWSKIILQEIFRVVLHHFLFQIIPKAMMFHLSMRCTKHLTYLLNKVVVLSY